MSNPLAVRRYLGSDLDLLIACNVVWVFHTYRTRSAFYRTGTNTVTPDVSAYLICSLRTGSYS